MKFIWLFLFLAITACASKVVMKNCDPVENGFFLCEEP
jgi:hypothetical protein